MVCGRVVVRWVAPRESVYRERGSVSRVLRIGCAIVCFVLLLLFCYAAVFAVCSVMAHYCARYVVVLRVAYKDRLGCIV